MKLSRAEVTNALLADIHADVDDLGAAPPASAANMLLRDRIDDTDPTRDGSASGPSPPCDAAGATFLDLNLLIMRSDTARVLQLRRSRRPPPSPWTPT